MGPREKRTWKRMKPDGKGKRRGVGAGGKFQGVVRILDEKYWDRWGERRAKGWEAKVRLADKGLSERWGNWGGWASEGKLGT